MRKFSISDRKNKANVSCLSYGVGHNREGICLQLNIGEYRIVLDCGIADVEALQIEPPDFIFCSHAHRDHCRGLPLINQAFPDTPIYTSQVTAKLLPLHWSSKINSTIKTQIYTANWRSPMEVAPNLEIELYPAGHLPGAAAILLTYKTREKNYKVLYTGDFSLSNFQLVEGLSIEGMRGIDPDILIIEGSYGTVRHPHRRQQEKQLMAKINQALMSEMNVLLPVDALGLGQEILKLLRSHHQFTGHDLDIWVDDNVAQACNVYLELLSQFPASVQNFAKHQSLFWDEKICPRMKPINNIEDIFQEKLPCVVLVDKETDLVSYLSSKAGNWLVLIPENPHAESPTSFISQVYGLKEKDFITIEEYLLAQHSDGRNTTQLIHNLRPQHVILVHGIASYLLELASLEELRNRYQVHSPANGMLLELPIGDRFIQPQNPTPTHYEGEINETDSSIAINIPHALNNDPRWNKFADTGIVEVRWQGDELILRGIPQRELLQPNKDRIAPGDLDCCQTCIHYHNHKCLNQGSPLYGFRVIPEGYCPVFEPKS